MGRAERRKAEKLQRANAKNVPLIPKHEVKDLVHKEIRKDLDKVRQEAIKRAVHDLTAAFIIAINSEFGFGKKRIARLLSRVNLQFECILADTCTIEDIKQWCLEHGFNYEDIFPDGR